MSTSASRLPRLRAAVRGSSTGHDAQEQSRAREARSARLRSLEVTEAARGRGWDSPWGPGRPGWHIECSAMSEKFLGEEFEIHGGGHRSRFPHHENELAQSRSLGHGFARIWMHNGMLRLDAAKMSKSLGNVVSLRNSSTPGAVKPFSSSIFPAHWSKPVDSRRRGDGPGGWRAQNVFATSFETRTSLRPDGSWERFAAALEDDFNTPAALAVVHEWRDHDLLRRALGVFGLESLAAARRGAAGSRRARAAAPDRSHIT